MKILKIRPVNPAVHLWIFFLFCFLPACRKGPADQGENPGYAGNCTVVQLQEDIRQARRFLEDSHPRLYRFTSQREFDSLYRDIHSKVSHPMGPQEFYSLLAPLVAAVGCGHTSLWPPEGYWDRAPQRMFPLGVHASNGQLFVIHGYNRDLPVSTGTRILSVNGIDSEELLENLLHSISSDGFIMSKRTRVLNNDFPIFYALMYGFPQQFELVVSAEGREKKLKLQPVSRPVIKTFRDSLVDSGVIPRKDLHLELSDPETALLRVRTFAYYDNNREFKRFIDSAFQVIRDQSIKYLIVDLRGNDGGDPFCSTHLLSYLEPEPIVYFRRPYGRYARFNKPLPMAENHFLGQQFYLIDGICFSTTGHLVSLAKYYRMGTFVGEETGATYTCNDASHDTRLTHSGLRLQSARFSFASAVAGFSDDRGILPDHQVRPSLDDVINNRDAVLEYTLELIKAQE